MSKLFIVVGLVCLFASCSYSQSEKYYSEPDKYFVRPCEFVCNHPYNDTTKWVITCRVWGLLKYYHPNVTAGKLDWDKVLLDGLQGIHHATTSEMVNAELRKMLEAAVEYLNNH